MENLSFLELPYEFKHVVYDYIYNLEYVKFKDIRFELMKEDSKESSADWLGYSYNKDGVPFVVLPPKLPDYAVDFVICHEIEHHELRLSGFKTYVIPRNKEDKNFEKWQGICNTLNSTLSDYVINKKLQEKYNLSSAPYNNHLLKSINASIDLALRHEPEEIEKITIPIWLTLRLLAAKLSSLEAEQLKLLMNRFKGSEIYEDGENIYREVLKIGLDTPESFNRSINKLVKNFRINDYVKVYN